MPVPGSRPGFPRMGPVYLTLGSPGGEHHDVPLPPLCEGRATRSELTEGRGQDLKSELAPIVPPGLWAWVKCRRVLCTWEAAPRIIPISQRRNEALFVPSPAQGPAARSGTGIQTQVVRW